MEPTVEQAKAVEMFKTGESMAIEAGAGTGKTSTLILCAEAAPERKGRYIAFNKAIAVEAGTKMPGNVQASTAHSLAWKAVVKNMKSKFAARLKAGRMSSEQVARIIGLRDPIFLTVEGQTKVLQPAYLAGQVMQAITTFCNSDDTLPGKKHLSYIEGIDFPGSNGQRRYDNNNEVAAKLYPYLAVAWKDIQSETGRLPFKHDHYLKIWERSNPVIDADFILFDEAQDASPVMLSIVTQQKNAQLVLVGDEQQSIYGWRGSINTIAFRSTYQ